MDAIDIRPLIEEIGKCVKRHELPQPGAYCRWLWPGDIWGDGGAPRTLGKNEYGCADAANILYTIGDFDCGEATRRARIRELQIMQEPETGLFRESSHDPIHTTAHCLGALELFGAKPLYPVRALHRYYDKNELYALLDGLDWRRDPWTQSHLGAGVYASLVNAGEMTEAFSKNYFGWLREYADAATGFWKKGFAEYAPCSDRRTVNGQASLYCYMAGGFHYLFNLEYAKQPLRYPEKVIDTCIRLFTENGLPDYFMKKCNFIETDWLYCMTRAGRQTGHRRGEREALIEEFARDYCVSLMRLDFEKDESFNDLHLLFGACCALAELQSALPGKILTEKPLRLVLDRRPFI
ncbi:MAG: hypothetical protein IJK23_14995 [Clostridia bacterium]|nr:hypothetical protein [Clostridia bacterium]